jgi:hypothetical protein
VRCGKEAILVFRNWDAEVKHPISRRTCGAFEATKQKFREIPDFFSLTKRLLGPAYSDYTLFFFSFFFCAFFQCAVREMPDLRMVDIDECRTSIKYSCNASRLTNLKGMTTRAIKNKETKSKERRSYLSRIRKVLPCKRVRGRGER